MYVYKFDRVQNSNIDNADFLIVGQGIAGTLLSWFLRKAGRSVIVLDKYLPGAASLVSAGIINPITGRRFAKSWLIETLLPFARQTYQEIGAGFGVSLWTERNLLRALPTALEENEWWRRSGMGDFAPYFELKPDLGKFTGKLQPVRAWGETKGAAQVDILALLQSWRELLRSENRLLEEEFDPKQLVLEPGVCLYRGNRFGTVVFCEGAKAVKNPWFGNLPFVPTKGESLFVRIEDVEFDKLLKHAVAIAPMGAGHYWVGASTRFEYEGVEPTVEMRAWLEERLRKALSIPFTVVSHHCGIRPTVFDIRPFLGRHPLHPSLVIFNGLGTKGASLAPYFACQLTEHILHGAPLHPEADIARFSSILKLQSGPTV